LLEHFVILALLALSAPFRIYNLQILLAGGETDPVSGHHILNNLAVTRSLHFQPCEPYANIAFSFAGSNSFYISRAVLPVLAICCRPSFAYTYRSGGSSSGPSPRSTRTH